jgi:hypothetical protein
MQGNRVYAPNDREHLFVDALEYLGFIGSVVIRRNIWLSRDKEPYIGTEFVHVGVIFQRPLTETVLIVAEPFISIRLGNAQWTPRSFDIWMFKWPKLVWSFDHISKEAKLKICRREPWKNFANLVIQRSYGAYTVQAYRQYISTMQAGVLWKFIAWLIACCPRKIIVSLHYFYSRSKGPEARAFFDAYIKW